MKTLSLLPVSAGSNGNHRHRGGLVGALRVRDGTTARSRVRQCGGTRCSRGFARADNSFSGNRYYLTYTCVCALTMPFR